MQPPQDPAPTQPDDGFGFTHSTLRANGINFHLVEHGPPDGPPVLLLHGFPEFWYSWRHQLRALGAAGYRALAPDLRGYNLTDKPSGVASYRTSVLAADVAALVRALGYEQVRLVGHDWGGAIAWVVATSRAHRAVVSKLVVLNAPHPARFLTQLSLDQLRRSWYMFFFQLPRLPEHWIRKDGFRMLRRMLRAGAARRDVFTDEDLDRYAEAFAQPGALTAAINYYRAGLRQNPLRAARELEPVQVPALLIWGEQDPALGKELTYRLPEVAPQLRIEYLPTSGHWVQQEEPEEVNRLLLEFLADPPPPC